ncbi:MAG: efflux RND transporter permease subunit [Gammaproteobacteria bacterium]|nr:efflux RND transporter permease subunit [Gammaproteobacteria bacterium]
MSRFFIDRPIFAWVIAIIIMLAGVLAIYQLPVEQYPDIAPPQVSVNANYPGASAATVEESVTQVIEQSMQGLDGLVYLSSNSEQGGGSVSLTFDAGTNPDTAQVQVQNKLQQALRRLPQSVQAQGVNVVKQQAGFLQMISFYSEDGTMSRAELNDYVATVIADELGRIPGVAGARQFGTPLAMHIWLDPYKLDRFRLVPGDVRQAVLAQNTQIATGELGDLPAVPGQPINATITAHSRLQSAQQFRDIVLRVNADGSEVRLGDVARIELDSESYTPLGWLNGKPASGIGIMLAPGANALKTAAAVQRRIADMEQFFPPSLRHASSFDTSEYVRISIREVVITLIEAIALVVLIMYLFLGSWRATLIPAIAVPVVLLGTFGVLQICGYSINTLTMFAMALAIGLLVDDAIVVVENVERIMHEEGLAPREATRKSMDQITGALFGIALVLAAVFVPMAFFQGSTGVIYRQFSITIVAAMTLSVLVALILSPALCATILRPVDATHELHRGGPIARFNRWLQGGTLRYQRAVGGIIRRLGAGFAVYAGILLVMGLLWWRLPTGFIPQEDQGALMVMVQLPPGSTQEKTAGVMARLLELAQSEAAAVREYGAFAGFSFGGAGQTAGMAFIRLKPWGQRDRAHSAEAIQQRLQRSYFGIRDADVFIRQPPTIRGLGMSSGFEIELKDLGGLGHEALAAARDRFLELAAQDPALTAVRAGGIANQPQFHVDIDMNKASALGLEPADVNDTLSSAFGSSYINDFINKGRVKKVYMQADAPFRMQPDDVGIWRVRNQAGEMVPLSAIATGRWTSGPPQLERYNGSSALQLTGSPSAGHSSGDAMAAVERLIAQLPQGIGFDWSGVSYQERLAGAQAPLLYAISIVFVFLCLAALYESWSVPFSVMLVVPLGVVGALLTTTLRGMDNDVYFQVGLITTIGLASKNAILIVEFAQNAMAAGASAVEATLQAARIRLRPILMTSCAFMLGVLPLALGTGAGAASRNAIGTGVFGGMLSATVLGIFLVPIFFIFVQHYFVRRPAGATSPPASR